MLEQQVLRNTSFIVYVPLFWTAQVKDTTTCTLHRKSEALQCLSPSMFWKDGIQIPAYIARMHPRSAKLGHPGYHTWKTEPSPNLEQWLHKDLNFGIESQWDLIFLRGSNHWPKFELTKGIPLSKKPKTNSHHVLSTSGCCRPSCRAASATCCSKLAGICPHQCCCNNSCTNLEGCTLDACAANLCWKPPVHWPEPWEEGLFLFFGAMMLQDWPKSHHHRKVAQPSKGNQGLIFFILVKPASDPFHIDEKIIPNRHTPTRKYCLLSLASMWDICCLSALLAG